MFGMYIMAFLWVIAIILEKERTLSLVVKKCFKASARPRSASGRSNSEGGSHVLGRGEKTGLQEDWPDAFPSRYRDQEERRNAKSARVRNITGFLPKNGQTT